MSMPSQHRRAYSGFPAGTLVRLADGSQRSIESVKVLDQIVTARGNVSRVVGPVAHWHEGVMVTPNCWGHSHLKCTPGYSILTKHGYAPADELSPGVDKVALPRYAAQTSLWIWTANHVDNRFHVRQTYRVKRSYQIPGKPAAVVTYHTPPDIIYLTHDFGRVIGFFLAEGHTAKMTVLWSFNKTERDTYAQEVVDKLASSCDGIGRIRMRTANNVAQVEMHGGQWSKMFESLCARGAENKRLNNHLTAGPLDFLEGVLTSWMDGDKCGSGAHGSRHGASISKELSMNMFDIANALGKMPIMSTHQRAHVPDRDGIYRKHAWKVGWGDRGKPNHGTEQNETHLFRKVRRIDAEPFRGYVYNLLIEGDNSFIAEGVGVAGASTIEPMPRRREPIVNRQKLLPLT